jgi:hypothetical protein
MEVDGEKWKEDITRVGGSSYSRGRGMSYSQFIDFEKEMSILEREGNIVPEDEEIMSID